MKLLLGAEGELVGYRYREIVLDDSWAEDAQVQALYGDYVSGLAQRD